MVNGDPTTFLFPIDLKVFCPQDPSKNFSINVLMGGSNYEEAKQNAINCYKRWYPDCGIIAI